MSPAAQNIIERLDQLRQKWWIFSLLSSAVWAASLSLALFLCFAVIDSVFKLSQTFLSLGFGIWILSTIALIGFVIRRVVISQRSLEGTARCLEAENPELESHLINLVQLSEDTENVDKSFCLAAVEQAARTVKDFPFERTSSKETRFRRFLYSLQTPRDFVEACCVFGMLCLLAVLGSALFPNWSSAAGRLTKPWDFVPSVGTVKIDIRPGNTEVLIGTPLEIVAETDEPITETPFKATLFVKMDGSDQEESTLMFLCSAQGDGKATPNDAEESKPVEEGRVRRSYAATIPVVTKPSSYRVEVGDSQSPKYRIDVLEKPTVADVEATYHYPAYMKRTPTTVQLRTPDLAAPQYTTAELKIRSTVPITTGRLDWDGGGAVGNIQDNGNILAAKMELVRTTSYRIRLQKDGFEDPTPRMNSVRVEPDKPPTVEMLRPTADVTLGIGQSVPIAVKLVDDFGISAVWIETKIREGGESVASDISDETGQDKKANRSKTKNETDKIHRWTINADESNTVLELEHLLPVTEKLIKPGQTLMVRVVAQDNRVYSNSSRGIDLTPQETAGPWRLIRTIEKEEAIKETTQQLSMLRDSLRKLMEKQIRNRVRTVLIGDKTTLDERAALAGEARTIQIEIQKEGIRIVKAIPADGRSEDLMIKRDLNRLAFGSMTKAVEQTDALTKLSTADAFVDPAATLQELQGQIADALRNMIGLARSSEAKSLEEMGYRSEDDLPDDVRKKMESLKKAVDEAMEAQRKVVEAARNLNKENVEDFSEEEEQLAQQLAAAEDAWEKFINELTTDLSKLPFQDFANPSLLQEMVELQTELAKRNGDEGDLAKCEDIAVPLEQLGTEMAEEIQTNMEKWLPDTADRERWSQEETVNDDEKEAPMAELPLELEDLIGELMEEEEDLFDEMEDISSSMIDSLDAGAGWDALDGPISNNSAKGVTGNRLPNTNEIAGRSGEGRQGKSGGEFVGEEAVGKGGRNTPTRLTPDPFTKGQIKDHSRDAVGGATGGGKEAGETGEGLEGPQARNRGDRERNRLPGKQADLRNRAEGIDLNHMKVMGYHNTDLEKMKDVMSQVEIDLQGGRYQNAQRQRRVLLESADDAKKHLGGEFFVKEDRSLNLPTNIQEQLVSGSDDPSPAGWESVNREYFRKLSEGTTGN